MKYSKGDKVTVILSEAAAKVLNIPGRAADLFSRDVISRTPAPFDMADAKPGMAWIGPYGGDGGGSKFFYYIGRSPCRTDMYVFTNARGGSHSWYAADIAQMPRAPENDKVME